MLSRDERIENKEYIEELMPKFQEHKPEFWLLVRGQHPIVGFLSTQEDLDNQMRAVNAAIAASSPFKRASRPAKQVSLRTALRLLKRYRRFELVDWSDFDWANT